MSAAAPFVCRFCGCTEANPCGLANGEPCWCFDREVCSNPSCIRAEMARRRNLRKPRPRSPFAGMGYGAVIEELRRLSRNRKQRMRRKAGKR